MNKLTIWRTQTSSVTVGHRTKKNWGGNIEGFNNNSFKHGGLNPLKLYIILKFKGLIPFKHSIENQ